MNIFKNNILVCNRFYFSYEFINFLDSNGIKFIIRIKGNGHNLKNIDEVSKYNKNYNNILKLKDKTRIITYDNVIYKTIHITNKKKYNKQYKFEIKNDCKRWGKNKYSIYDAFLYYNKCKKLKLSNNII